MKFDTDHFAAKLRGKRAELDISQAQLAELTGLTIATIGAYESGSSVPGADKVALLCCALGVQPNDFFLSVETN